MAGLALHTVIETPEFQRRTEKLLTKAEREALIDYLAANPDAGDVIRGTGGARKVRWTARGKGKRGGVRVVTFLQRIADSGVFADRFR